MKTINHDQRLRTCHGFTLLELTFVAFLFLLMAGLSSAIFRQSFNLRSQNTAAQNLMDWMQFAHDRAITERMSYGIHLDPNQNKYWLVRCPDDQSNSESERISGTWGSTQQLPMGTSFKGDETVVMFYPDGTATQASLEIAGHDYSLMIQVNPVDGKSEVHEQS